MNGDRVGVSSACWYPLPLEDALEEAGQAGFRTCELFVNTLSETEEPILSKLLEIRDRYGMEIVSLHPFSSLAESFFLFSAYERRFEDTLTQYERYFRFAETLGARIFVLHGMKLPGEVDLDTYAYRFARLSELAAKHGVDVCHENVVRHCCGDPAYLARLAERVGDGFHVVLDTKQAHRAGFTPFDFLEKLGDRVRHVHISDHAPDMDCVPPYSGELDIPRFLRETEKRGFRGSYVIELYRWGWSDISDLTTAADRLRADLAAV